MPRQARIALVVYVDLDNIPGAMHTKESARNMVDGILKRTIPNYNPMVSIAPASIEPSGRSISDHAFRTEGYATLCTYGRPNEMSCARPYSDHLN